jgi:hypothetical protein
MLFPDLVREVSAYFADGRARRVTIGEMGEELGEHPWRVVDAIEAMHMVGFE